MRASAGGRTPELTVASMFGLVIDFSVVLLHDQKTLIGDNESEETSLSVACLNSSSASLKTFP